MSTASCPAPPYRECAHLPAVLSYQPRRWAVSCFRGLVFCVLFSVILVPEFSRDGNPATGALLYNKAAGSFRFIDLGIFGLVASHVIALACSRRKAIYFPQTLALPGAAFLVCILSGIGYGSLRGGTNFFFDWRALALGIGLYFVWAVWIQSESAFNSAVHIFAIYMAVRIVVLYALHLSGSRNRSPACLFQPSMDPLSPPSYSPLCSPCVTRDLPATALANSSGRAWPPPHA